MQNERRIVLVGKTGNGKSSTGNSILQKNAFIHRVSANAVTVTSVMGSSIKYANNKFYTVVDTPGLLDTETSVSERALEIQRSVVDICPKPHVFLIIFSAANRITADERFTIEMLHIIFGECIFDHSIVVFTNGNKFQSDAALQQYWRENEILVNLINRCGNRVVKIENAHAIPYNNAGLQRIFEMIESMSNAGKKVYTYTGLQTHRSVIEEHSQNYLGNGKLQEELNEIVRRIADETRRIEEETRRIEEERRNRRIRNTILAGAGGIAVGAVGVMAGPGLVAAASSSAVTTGVVAVGGATIKVAMDVARNLRF